MKKTILAVALGLVAGTASAANIYTNTEHGVNVDVHGAAEVQYFQGFEFYDQDTDAKIRIDDGELNFLTTVEMDNNMKALAYFDFEVESGDAQNDELWIGLETAHGTFKAGRLKTVWDDSGVNQDYELAMDDLGDFGPTVISTFSEGNNTVRYDLEMGNVYAAVAHNLKETNSNVETSGTDAKVGVKFGPVDVRGFYQISKTDGDLIGELELNAYALEAEYTLDAVVLSAGYKDVESKDKDNDVTGGYKTITVSAKYTFEDLTLAGGLNRAVTTDDLEDITASNLYVNLTKQMHENVRVYGEIGYTDINFKDSAFKDDDSFAYVAGMEVSF